MSRAVTGHIPPAQVPPAETPGLSGLLTLAVSVVVVAALYFAREVLIPITLSVLLSFVLAPLVNLLRRIYFGRVLSALCAVVLGLAVILAIGGVIGTQIAGLVNDVPRYETTVEHKVEMVRGLTVGRIDSIINSFGRRLDQPAGTGPAAKPQATRQPGQQQPVPVEVQQPSPSPVTIAEQILAPVISPLATMAIVFIFTIFILLQREDLRDRLIRLFGSGDLHRTHAAMNDAARRLSRYFLTQLAINTSFGIIITGGLFAIGVPSPIMGGALGTLLRFVPYVGAPLAAVIPVALAAAVDPGWSMVIWTVGLYFGTELIMGQVVEPTVYGHSTGLSPFSVVVAATFWTWLWGPIGLILSTPLTLCLVVLGRHVERLEFLDVLLGDRPALTPVESFYQRMLAGDPDEAVAQAELMLKSRSLSAYYDVVALPGLQLAANDMLRGVLSEQQLARIKAAVVDLVGELANHHDVDPNPEEEEDEVSGPTRAEQDLPRDPAPAENAPPPEQRGAAWQGECPVLCLAGRGPLDDAAAIMLAQLLEKHGLKARVADHAAASREQIGTLDLQGVAMICVSYLTITGTPSHLRYMLRRLRQRLPSAQTLVGLWPVEDEILRDERLRATLGADLYVSSLQQAVEACVAAAWDATGERQGTDRKGADHQATRPPAIRTAA